MLQVQDTLGNQLPIDVSVAKEAGIVQCTYTPKSTLPHVIQVNYSGVAAAESPYRVYISNPPDVTKIKIFGDWFETKTKINIPNTFYVDASNVDISDLNVWLLHEESGQKIPVQMHDEKGVYLIEVLVEHTGNYLTKIYYGGIPIPIKQKVYVPPNKHIPSELLHGKADICPDKVRVYGAAFECDRLHADTATNFNIDVSDAGGGIVAVSIFNMHNVPVDNVFVVNKGGGLYTVNFIVPNENSIIISVKFAHQHVGAR